MSFWTGFTTGLASSVDKGLQRAIEKRDGELSAAKKFWMQTKATKKEKYDIKKEKEDAEAVAGYRSLLDGFNGNADMAKAAFDSLAESGGGVAGVTDYLSKVRQRTDELGSYDISLDFKDFKAGDTAYTGGEEGLLMPEYQGTAFKAADYGVGSSRLDELFGRTGADTDTARLEKQMNVGFNAQPAAAPAASTGAFGSIDRSRLSAAETYARQKTVEAQQDAKVQRDITAFGTNQARVKALTQQIADQEERAKRGELDAKEQKTYDRNRDELADAERKTELEQKAEMFVLNKQAKKLDITAKELANKKAQEPPQFNDFEEMAVHYAGKLAEEGLTSQQESDYTDLMNNAIEGAKAWNEKTAAKGKAKSPFSPENRTSVFNAAVKKELAPYGLVNDLGLEIATEIEGNEPTYFAGMNRALVALNKQTAALQDSQFNSVIDSAVETLKERVSIYKANPDNNLPDDKQPQSADEAFTPAFTSELEAGDVVRYNTPQGEVSMVWLGTRYYTQPVFETSR